MRGSVDNRGRAAALLYGAVDPESASSCPRRRPSLLSAAPGGPRGRPDLVWHGGRDMNRSLRTLLGVALVLALIAAPVVFAVRQRAEMRGFKVVREGVLF